MSGPPPPPLTYVPAPHEREYYGRLFQAADVQHTGTIGGAQAVQFFTRSKLGLESLKNIWNLADQHPSTHTLDARKFAVAVRLIQLEQNGVPIPGPDLAATPPLRPVFIEGIPPPPSTTGSPSASIAGGPPQPEPGMSQAGGAPPSNPRPPSPQQQQHPPRVPGGSSMAGSVASQPPQQQLALQDPYSMTPTEQARYEALFPEYTSDEYMTGAQAVALFTKSGLDNTVLAQIWNLVDSPVDNKLDKLEFCMAMHLIVCVSKKNLSVPPHLPMSLKTLKSQQTTAPASNITIPNMPQQQQGGMPPPPPQPMPQGGMPQQQQSGLQQQQPPPPQPTYAMAPSSTEGGIPSPTRGPPPAVQPATSSLSGLAGPPPISSSTVSISDAFEGLNATGAADTGSITSFGATTPIPPPPVLTVPEHEVEQAPQMPDMQQQQQQQKAAPPPASTQELARSYDMGEAQVELDKLRGALQKLQAENISLKATLGTLSEDEKDVQKELAATIAEITTLSGTLTTLRAQVLASKSRLLEATAELKAAKEKKGTITDLITEATATKEAIDDAYDGIETANTQVHAPPPPAPEPTSETDFFGWGNDAAPAPPIPQTAREPPQPEESAPAPQTVDIPAPQPQELPEPPKQVAPTYQPTNIYNGGGYTHNRNASASSAFGEVMGGAPSDLAASYDDLPATPSIKEIDDLKARSREADDVARDAEESRRQLSAQLNELRRLADEAEAKSRAASDKPAKKKGTFRRGNKKHDAKEAARLATDAKDKKDAMLLVQSQLKDAEALASATKTESERLRNEAEDAQMQAATAASMQAPAPTPQPAPVPVPDTVGVLPTFNNQAPTNGGGLNRMAPNEAPSYSMIVTEVDQKPPTGYGMGYGAPPSGFDANVMGGGGNGLDIPTPSNDAYANPFE